MKTIEEIIKRCLDELGKISNEEEQPKNGQESKLIFPIYHNGKHKIKKRVSEQEARLLFIRELEKEKDNFYYSIETPTTKLYNFSNDKRAPKILTDNLGELKGQSASFDLTIYNNKFLREHFVEFKNNNVNTVKKDFLKLLCDEEGKKNYLVHIINRNDLNQKNTLKSIIEKYDEAIKNAKIYEIVSTLNVVLYNINKGHEIWFEEITKDTIKIKENKTTSLPKFGITC